MTWVFLCNGSGDLYSLEKATLNGLFSTFLKQAMSLF